MNRIFNLLLLLVLWVIRGHAQPSDAALPLLFVPNEGQWEQGFLYKGISANADIYLEKDGITYVVGDAANPGKMHAYKELETTVPPVLRFHAYRVKWVGAQMASRTTGSKKQQFYHNYFLGNDPARWKGGVGIYGNVDYENIYRGIDLHVSSEKGHAKYDFIVKAGASPALIRMAYEGLDGIKLSNGNLLLQTSVGQITEMAPYAYQYIDGVLREVPCHYRLDGAEVRFEFPEGYDKRQNLIIDPTIVFATLTGSTADNWGFSATYDHAGNLYAGGISNGLGYPVTTGAFQTTFGGGTPGSSMPCDITISKFNPSGTGLVYSTYIGGNADDMPHSLVVDNANQLVVAGKTLSNNYPVTSNAFDGSYNDGYDIIVTKFNAAGTGLVGSTYVGGSGNDGINISAGFAANQGTLKFNYGDDSRSEVIVDKAGNVYVAASSRSNNFPVTPNAAKANMGGMQDGVFFKMNPSLSTMIYSTYVGGNSGEDAAYVLTLDTGQTHVYVAGGTWSTDFPASATAGTWKPTFQGGVADGYICKFQNSGSYTLEKATYIGTPAYDQCYGIQTDLENRVYAMGQTMGAFPVSAGVYSNPGSRQFLIKLDSMLTAPIYSTVFGSGPAVGPNISPVAFLVDTCQNVYISGWGGSITPASSTNNLPVTNDAFQPTTDGNDFYFIVFSKNALGLLFGSYFGSPSKAEHVDGGTSRFDPDGVVYQAICASCGPGSAFPASSNAYAATKGSNNCNLGAVKIAFNLGSVDAEAGANPNTTGCAPLTVNFSNNSTNATSYVWDFDDGSGQSTQATPTHVFTDPGTYNVMMVAINPNACKTHDTVMLQIHVSSDTIHAAFDYVLRDTCTNPNITITNTSAPMPGHTLANATFQWYFGDNTSFTGQNPGVHNYAGPGSYDVMMIMTDPAACNSPDTVIRTVVINQVFVDAGFLVPDTICLGDSTVFVSTSVNGSTYQWSFGDGNGTATTETAGYRFANPGTYRVKLVVSNPNSCNKVDSAESFVTVNPNPIASFSFTPATPETNVPTSFFNQSQNATRYQWAFGDGSGSEEENPVHSYRRSGTYNVCLTAFNQQGCSAKVCRTVTADVLPLADVPTGFSPNGDGSNDVLYVRGYSIQTLDFKIFNRWGELVFETQNQSIGWDGTYKGKPQEMDAYAFVLQVTFFDGTSMKKQGNVTLLR